jgi:hypothetical protein
LLVVFTACCICGSVPSSCATDAARSDIVTHNNDNNHTAPSVAQELGTEPQIQQAVNTTNKEQNPGHSSNSTLPYYGPTIPPPPLPPIFTLIDAESGLITVQDMSDTPTTTRNNSPRTEQTTQNYQTGNQHY